MSFNDIAIDTYKKLRAALGLKPGALGTPANTQPATAQGIFNNTVGVAAVKVLNGRTTSTVTARRVTIVAPGAAHIGYTWVAAGAAAPTLTAGVAGTATDGSLVRGAGPPREIVIPDTVDLYLAASAAATPYQLEVVEIP